MPRLSRPPEERVASALAIGLPLWAACRIAEADPREMEASLAAAARRDARLMADRAALNLPPWDEAEDAAISREDAPGGASPVSSVRSSSRASVALEAAVAR